jgi:hypothetical protein
MKIETKTGAQIVLTVAASLAAFWGIEPALPQNAKTAITGECIPHTVEQGPWDCAVKGVVKINCEDAMPNSAELQKWAKIGSEAEAEKYVTAKYQELNNLQKFAQWFACQGFNTNAFGPHDSFPNDPRATEFGIGAVIGPRDNRPLIGSWGESIGVRIFKYLVPAYGFDFEISLTKFGSLSKIQYGETRE